MSGRAPKRRAVVTIAALIAGSVSSLNGASAEAVQRVPDSAPIRVAFSGSLTNHRSATVYTNGLVTIRDGRKSFARWVPVALRGMLLHAVTPSERRQLLAALSAPAPQRFAPASVNVVLREGVTMASDVVNVDRSRLQAFVRSGGAAPRYSSDERTNAAFARLGVDRVERLARTIPKATISALAMRASSATVKPSFDLAQAYTLHLTNASVGDAVRELSALRSVAFAEPNWTVAPMDTGAVPVPAATAKLARLRGAEQRNWHVETDGSRLGADTLPNNYGIASSEESYLNAPGIDAVAAYDAIENRFGQLPGTGETITNLSLGDVCPASSNSGEAPTSHQIGGQNYLDVPSMPLIPEYVVDDDGNASGSASVCGVDPQLGEILLDFSVMAPLPHSMQRAGAVGSGLTDLLGIAPGAKYRLVVPQDTEPTTASFVASLLAASTQTPRPDVITMSIGYGLDEYGFPTRYLEQDPVIQSTIALLVSADDIVVCVASGDGLREYTNAAVSPSGGSAPLDAVTSAASTTSLGDVSSSTVPSKVLDSGAIAAGGTTTDDIFAAPPQDPQNAAFANQLAFPEVRWDGAESFASAFGSRVDLSAPSDNIPVLELDGSGYNQVVPAINGGTSASTPMIAAAAAVALQVARLTGHPFTSALAVRSFLEKTATAIPKVEQADTAIAVGPQVDVEGMVEALAGRNGALPARLPRVAIAQRQSGNFGDAACFENGRPGYIANDDNEFTEATDPTDIVLDETDACGDVAGNDLNAYITIAPDWESIPKGATYRLYVTSHPRRVLSRNRWLRILPEELFRKAGVPLVSSSPRTISFTYEADAGAHRIASVTFALTFGPTDGRSQRVLAPVVPPVATGATIPVRYDFSSYPQAFRYRPAIVVSYPGRPNFVSGPIFYPLWVSPRLNGPKGTVNVPVSALLGDGIYGIAVRMSDVGVPGIPFAGRYSDFATTRVATGSSKRPAAPLLALAASPAPSSGATPAPGHTLEIPFGGSFTVHYDVSSIPHATNAILEISSDGPTFYNLENPFNNPNGSTIDDNGHDSGSVYQQTLSGTRGSVTLTAAAAKLVPSMMHVVRVLPANGSTVVGESSDVSSIAEDGITAPDGQALTSGYAIDPAGDDAEYTSNGEAIDSITGGLDATTAFGTFSQSTGANESWNSKTGALGTIPLFTLAGGGFVANDTLVMSSGATASTPLTYFSGVPPFVNPNPYPFWPLPLPPYSHVVEMGNNPIGQTSAFLVEQNIPNAQPSFFGLTANVGAQTLLAGPIPLDQTATGYPNTEVFDYDASANAGYALFASFPLVLASIDFATGSTAYTSFPYYGSANDFAIDPNTHVGAFTMVYYNADGGIGSGLAIVDLTTATITKVVPISVNPLAGLIAVDPTNKLFAVQVAFPKADKTDNNPLSSVAFVSENGTVVGHTARLYNLGSAVLQNHWFGLNPTTRKGFMFGPPTGIDFYQIIPFSY